MGELGKFKQTDAFTYIEEIVIRDRLKGDFNLSAQIPVSENLLKSRPYLTEDLKVKVNVSKYSILTEQQCDASFVQLENGETSVISCVPNTPKVIFQLHQLLSGQKSEISVKYDVFIECSKKYLCSPTTNS